MLLQPAQPQIQIRQDQLTELYDIAMKKQYEVIIQHIYVDMIYDHSADHIHEHKLPEKQDIWFHTDPTYHVQVVVNDSLEYAFRSLTVNQTPSTPEIERDPDEFLYQYEYHYLTPAQMFMILDQGGKFFLKDPFNAIDILKALSNYLEAYQQFSFYNTHTQNDQQTTINMMYDFVTILQEHISHYNKVHRDEERIPYGRPVLGSSYLQQPTTSNVKPIDPLGLGTKNMFSSIADQVDHRG